VNVQDASITRASCKLKRAVRQAQVRLSGDVCQSLCLTVIGRIWCFPTEIDGWCSVEGPVDSSGDSGLDGAAEQLFVAIDCLPLRFRPVLCGVTRHRRNQDGADIRLRRRSYAALNKHSSRMPRDIMFVASRQKGQRPRPLVLGSGPRPSPIRRARVWPCSAEK